MSDARLKLAIFNVFGPKIGQLRRKEPRQNAEMRHYSIMHFVHFRFIAERKNLTSALACEIFGLESHMHAEYHCVRVIVTSGTSVHEPSLWLPISTRPKGFPCAKRLDRARRGPAPFCAIVSACSSDLLSNILGKDFGGVLVSDCLAIYDDATALQQKC